MQEVTGSSPVSPSFLIRKKKSLREKPTECLPWALAGIAPAAGEPRAEPVNPGVATQPTADQALTARPIMACVADMGNRRIGSVRLDAAAEDVVERM